MQNKPVLRHGTFEAAARAAPFCHLGPFRPSGIRCAKMRYRAFPGYFKNMERHLLSDPLTVQAGTPMTVNVESPLLRSVVSIGGEGDRFPRSTNIRKKRPAGAPEGTCPTRRGAAQPPAQQFRAECACEISADEASQWHERRNDHL